MHELVGGIGVAFAAIGLIALLVAAGLWFGVGKHRAELRSAASATGYAFTFIVVATVLLLLSRLP